MITTEERIVGLLRKPVYHPSHTRLPAFTISLILDVTESEVLAAASASDRLVIEDGDLLTIRRGKPMSPSVDKHDFRPMSSRAR